MSIFSGDAITLDNSGRIKVCIISIAYWPFHPGQGTRMSKIYSDLLHKDSELTVITSHSVDTKSNFLSVEYDKTGTKIVRIPYISFKDRSITSRFLNLFSFSMACLLAHKHIERGSILFTCGPPEVPYLVITTSILKFFKSVKHLGLVTDMLPDVAFDLGIIKSNIVRKMVTSICVYSYKKADHVVVITNYLKKRLIEYGIPARKITRVGLAVDSKLFSPDKPIIDSNAISISSNKNRFIVLYSGSFGKMYNFDPLLEAAKLLKKYPDIHFVIRGDGDQRQYISERIKEMCLTNVSLFGPVSDTDNIISFINCASVCIVPIRGSKNIDMTHPSKMFEFWSCQKPIICSTAGETKNLIDKYKVGIAIPPDDPKAIFEAILYFYDNRNVAKEMGINARKLVESEFSYLRIKEQLINVIRNMTEN
ncbi:MAG TPA: glycosyltransferase family 4 protein [Nitrososphaeraceae archaeon]|nr:glycosyltransferase family 4 protein [Nitrososphaeraceae archaeon]